MTIAPNTEKPKKKTFKRKPKTASGEQKEKVCFAFQKGECTRGETCKFKHVLETKNE